MGASTKTPADQNDIIADYFTCIANFKAKQLSECLKDCREVSSKIMCPVVFGFFFLLLLQDCSSFRKSDDSEVLTVTSLNFDQKIPIDKLAVVLFFAPWQDSCESSHDLLDKIAEYFKENEDIVIAKGNIYNDGKLASRFDVEDYCKIKYFVKGSRVAEG